MNDLNYQSSETIYFINSDIWLGSSVLLGCTDGSSSVTSSK